MKGFEPLNVGTKIRCLTTWRHPNNLAIFTKFEKNIAKLNVYFTLIEKSIKNYKTLVVKFDKYKQKFIIKVYN